jgi:hypothetical protein
MQLLAPEILAEARGLTEAMCGTLCVLGFALWLFGWRWHRFWIVAGVTLGAGLFGLHAGRGAGGTQILAVGLLLAVAAGMMALELAKIFAFVAGGCGAWFAVQWVVPQAQELWAVFLCGGLFGLLLYRLWTMLLTSLLGVVLAAHAGLLLVEQLAGFDAAAWVGENQAAGNGLVVGLTVLGVLLQAVASPDDAAGTTAEEKKPKRSNRKKPRDRDDRDEPDDRDDREGRGAREDRREQHPWWRKLFGPGPQSPR